MPLCSIELLEVPINEKGDKSLVLAYAKFTLDIGDIVESFAVTDNLGDDSLLSVTHLPTGFKAATIPYALSNEAAEEEGKAAIAALLAKYGTEGFKRAFDRARMRSNGFHKPV